MKYCHNCGNAMEDNSLFCAACGTRVAPESPSPANTQEPRTQQMTDPWTTPAATPTPQPSYAPYTNPYTPQQPAQEPKPKKKKTGMIIGIILGSLVVIGLLGKLLGGGSDSAPANNDSNGSLFNIPDSDGGSYVDVTPEVTSTDAPKNDPVALSYTKGAITNGLYVNEWADLQFDTTGWTNGSAEAYAEEEVDYTDCGLLLEYSDGFTELTIDFIRNVPSDEEACMDSFLEGLKESFVGISGLTANVSDSYDTTVAGKTYKTVTLSATYNGYSFVQVYCMHYHIDRLILIIITAEDATTADNVAANILSVE